MASQGTFRPSAEAEEKDVLVAEQAAISRLRPIQDGLDYWEEHRSSGASGSGGPEPGRARTMFCLSWEMLYTKSFFSWPDNDQVEGRVQMRLQGAPPRESPPGDLRRSSRNPVGPPRANVYSFVVPFESNHHDRSQIIRTLPAWFC
jgi:hypothetical protein